MIVVSGFLCVVVLLLLILKKIINRKNEPLFVFLNFFRRENQRERHDNI